MNWDLFLVYATVVAAAVYLFKHMFLRQSGSSCNKSCPAAKKSIELKPALVKIGQGKYLGNR